MRVSCRTLFLITILISYYDNQYIIIIIISLLQVFKLFNKFTDFLKIWYERCSVGGQHNIMFTIFYNKYM